MTAADRARAEQALEWVRRIHDPSFADWEEHVRWLESDPRNAPAFDEASLALEEAADGLAPPRERPLANSAINDNLPPAPTAGRLGRRPWSALFGGAVAAGLVAVVTIPTVMRSAPQNYAIQTAPGERRTIRLDGTVIALAGDSSLRLDRADERRATLERGEAFFDVQHDAAHPFKVAVGGRSIQDVGTQFDIDRRNGVTEIAVREGAVLYDPGQANVQLVGGQSLRVENDVATVGSVEPAAVGGWRSGRLVYRDAPLGDVAEDIARNIGEPVIVAPTLTRRHFSGVVMIDPDRARMFSRMAAVMGVDVRHSPRGWQMVSPIR